MLLLSTFFHAQLSLQLRDARFGVTAGANYSRVTNVHSPSKPRYSFDFGGLALIPLDYNDQLFIQAQLEYLGSGEKGDGDTKYTNDYISVPIYFKGYFTNAESEMFGFVGPRFAFSVNEKIENPNKPIYYAEENGGGARKFDLALSLGIGYSHKRQVETYLRYDFGILNKYPDMKDIPGIKDSEKAKRQHILMLGVSYIFN